MPKASSKSKSSSNNNSSNVLIRLVSAIVAQKECAPTLLDPTVFHIPLPARSPPFATAFERSEHALLIGRHRRRRRRQRDYDEEAENDDSDALSISRVALEDRESEEFVCLLVPSAASERQADLRSRTNDFAFRAGGPNSYQIEFSANVESPCPLEKSPNNNSSSMDFDDFSVTEQNYQSLRGSSTRKKIEGDASRVCMLLLLLLLLPPPLNDTRPFSSSNLKLLRHRYRRRRWRRRQRRRRSRREDIVFAPATTMPPPRCGINASDEEISHVPLTSEKSRIQTPLELETGGWKL
ncbi:hypothetical protein M0802_009737 [Mischocyttarus mexicanus]|nr:hypothetical protein M0802_009737 [Mischocyttarus mexicanus]